VSRQTEIVLLLKIEKKVPRFKNIKKKKEKRKKHTHLNDFSIFKSQKNTIQSRLKIDFTFESL